MSDLPVACTLDEGTLRTRREGLLAQLTASAFRREWRPSGLRLEFVAGSETLGLIARAMDAERKCCRFLQFQLTVTPDEGPVVLELIGPVGTREFLEALIAS
jgi:hypothetical protein